MGSIKRVYAGPRRVVSQYAKEVAVANGIILSPDEKTLYVTAARSSTPST